MNVEQVLKDFYDAVKNAQKRQLATEEIHSLLNKYNTTITILQDKIEEQRKYIEKLNTQIEQLRIQRDKIEQDLKQIDAVEEHLIKLTNALLDVELQNAIKQLPKLRILVNNLFTELTNVKNELKDFKKKVKEVEKTEQNLRNLTALSSASSVFSASLITTLYVFNTFATFPFEKTIVLSIFVSFILATLVFLGGKRWEM